MSETSTWGFHDRSAASASGGDEQSIGSASALLRIVAIRSSASGSASTTRTRSPRSDGPWYAGTGCPAVGCARSSVDRTNATTSGSFTVKVATLPSPALALLEPVEDDREQLAPDPGAGVADHDLEVRVDALERELDPAVPRRELDGVHQEIPGHLLEPVRVAAHRAGARVEERMQLEPLGVD